MVDLILHKEIFIPLYNEYPLEKGQAWAKRGYKKALPQVDKRQKGYLKSDFQIRAADYVENMTFIKWRLTGPTPKEKNSSLDTLLESLKPYISNWGGFRWTFADHLKKAFVAIHNSNYLPAMIQDRNNWLNQLLKESANGVTIHLEFVTHPDTAESYDSPRFLEMRSRIWEFYTGKPLDMTKYVPVTTPIPGRPIQMEMHLDIQISKL